MWDLLFCKRDLVCLPLLTSLSHYMTQKQDKKVRAYIEVGGFYKNTQWLHPTSSQGDITMGWGFP